MAHYTGTSAKAALVALIETALAGSGASVTYGAPFPWPGSDVVSVGDVETDRSAPRFGQRTTDEEHRITVTIRCGRANGQQRTTTERAAVLLDLIDDALRAVASQNIAPAAGIYLGYIVGRIDLVEDDDEDRLTRGRSAALTFAVTAKSRRT